MVFWLGTGGVRMPVRGKSWWICGQERRKSGPRDRIRRLVLQLPASEFVLEVVVGGGVLVLLRENLAS